MIIAVTTKPSRERGNAIRQKICQRDAPVEREDQLRAILAHGNARSPDRADALIGAIVLGQESQSDWKQALALQKEIKHQMQLDYWRTGRGRPQIE
jgi:hypothetical protein